MGVWCRNRWRVRSEAMQTICNWEVIKCTKVYWQIQVFWSQKARNIIWCGVASIRMVSSMEASTMSMSNGWSQV